jgi:hypothetical protein
MLEIHKDLLLNRIGDAGLWKTERFFYVLSPMPIVVP